MGLVGSRFAVGLLGSRCICVSLPASGVRNVLYFLGAQLASAKLGAVQHRTNDLRGMLRSVLE
jgi:hypothetical protein